MAGKGAGTWFTPPSAAIDIFMTSPSVDTLRATPVEIEAVLLP